MKGGMWKIKGGREKKKKEKDGVRVPVYGKGGKGKDKRDQERNGFDDDR